MNLMIGALEIEKREQRSGRGFGRNILIALTIATLAGIIAFQALGPATFESHTDLTGEVFDSSEGMLAAAPSGTAGLIK